MSQTTVILLSLVAALIPTIFYVALIYWADRYEKEPWWLLAATFLWGAVPSIIIAFILNTVFSISFYAIAGPGAGETLAASLIAPPVEETVKGLALVAILFRWRNELDSPLDGIIYGAMVGMGFAMVENVFYFVGTYNQGGAEAWGINVFMRGVIFGLNHALFTAMAGLGIAIARMSTDTLAKLVAPSLGWMMAIFLHFLHNFSVSFGNLLCLIALISDWGGVWLTIGIITWALVQERRWIKRYLAEEVEAGRLTTAQYETAVSGRKRFGDRIGRLLNEGFDAYLHSLRFYRRCAKLAYKKHHFELFQDNDSRQSIGQLRDEIAAMNNYTPTTLSVEDVP